nr:MAG TPA: YtxH-like protein [Caudoviricetes sp.]
MVDTIQTAGPYILSFWFGGAFGFVVCAFFAGRKR